MVRVCCERVSLINGDFRIPPNDLNQTIQTLVASTKGRIVASNIVASVQHQLISKDLASEVLSWVGLILKEERTGDPLEAVKALEYVLARSYPNNNAPFRDAPDYRLQCCSSQNEKPVPALSTIVRLRTLDALVHEEDKELLPPLLENATESLGKQMLDDWQERMEKQGKITLTVRVDPVISLGKRNGVIWFTPRSDLESIFAEQTSVRAQQARDVLGLVHHGIGTPLAALHFKPVTFEDIKSARPTFIDAGGHTRFKTWPDGEDAQEDRHWGVTVDLTKLMDAAPELDGCLECVASSIDRSENGIFPIECEFEYLGIVQENTGAGSQMDRSFVRRLSGGLGRDRLKQKLTELLN